MTSDLAQRVEAARANVRRACANATESDKLCNRTATALDHLYKIKDMAQLIRVLRDLGKQTLFDLCSSKDLFSLCRCVHPPLFRLLRPFGFRWGEVHQDHCAVYEGIQQVRLIVSSTLFDFFDYF